VNQRATGSVAWDLDILRTPLPEAGLSLLDPAALELATRGADSELELLPLD
jgi:hypothetical protein